LDKWKDFESIVARRRAPLLAHRQRPYVHTSNGLRSSHDDGSPALLLALPPHMNLLKNSRDLAE
jgi:hypothetical protein